MTTAATRFSPPTREVLAPLLLRRFRQISGPILIGTGAFAVMHVWLGEPNLSRLLVLKAVQAAVVAIGLAMSTHMPSRRMIVGWLLTLFITIQLVTAATGLLIGNTHTNALLHVVTALASSSFLPWGATAQTLSVLAATAAATLPLLSDLPVYHDFWYDLVALLVAYAISIYIAREVENDTLAEHRAQAATRALAESRANFETVFRTSNVMLTTIELAEDEFVFEEVNESLGHLFGLNATTMAGMRASQLGFSRTQIDQWMQQFRRCAIEGSLIVPEYLLDVVTPPRWFHISFSRIRDQNLRSNVRLWGVGVDITELRRATEDVRRLNTGLEAQVEERTALLEGAIKDLESFAYSVSHDLRTPLRSIEGFAAMLRDEHGREFSGETLEQLQRIQGASRHMAQLIDDLLTLSRASRSEVHRQPVDLSMLCREIGAELRSANSKRGATIEVESGMMTRADPRLLRIVMENLLGNAWKYTEQCGHARIEVGSASRGEERVYFVRDNGCGFEMQYVGKLFQPFQRLHANDEFEGTGIGLATVARIVRRHGGRVWAEGEPGNGATFSFTLGNGRVIEIENTEHHG